MPSNIRMRISNFILVLLFVACVVCNDKTGLGLGLGKLGEGGDSSVADRGSISAKATMTFAEPPTATARCPAGRGVLISGECREGVWNLRDTTVAGRTFVRQAIKLGVPPESVWAVLTDSSKIKGFMPKVHDYKAIAVFPDSQHILCIGKPHILLPTMICTLTVRYKPCEEITWSQYAGDAEALEGSWTLIPMTSDSTVAIYSIHFLLRSVLVPDALARHKMRGLVSEMLRKVKNSVEGQ
jgi:hypothetical protein